MQTLSVPYLSNLLVRKDRTPRESNQIFNNILPSATLTSVQQLFLTQKDFGVSPKDFLALDLITIFDPIGNVYIKYTRPFMAFLLKLTKK